MTSFRKPQLGKGLAALLGENNEENQSSGVQDILIDLILPNKDQPRKEFNKEELQNLAESIKQQGILQPVLVRPHAIFKEKFEIIAGERRWRAATIAQFKTIPALVRHIDNQKSLELALVENIQRQDLHILEEAESYQKLMTIYQYSQEELAKIIGKSRSHIANILRLNTLNDTIKGKLRSNQITAGHARALINCQDPEHTLNTIITQNYTVRETEDLVRHHRPLPFKKRAIKKYEKNEDISVLEHQLQELLNMPVHIEIRENSGTVILSFKNLMELDQLIKRIHTFAA